MYLKKFFWGFSEKEMYVDYAEEYGSVREKCIWRSIRRRNLPKGSFPR